MTQYNFSKTPVALDHLERDIRASASITVALDHSTWTDPDLSVIFRADLSADEQTALAAIVAAHDGTPLPATPVPTDSDRVSFARIKQTTLGWTFQDHSFEFKPGTLNAVYSKKENLTDWGFVTVSFYELVGGVETLITLTGDNTVDQVYLTANCVKTRASWEMTNDFDVIAGECRYGGAQIDADVRLWVVVAPDIPANLGGSKELLTGGRNLRYVSPNEPIVLDGRTTKHLGYNATYHTNKFRFTLRHPVGFAQGVETCVQLYKL